MKAVGLIARTIILEGRVQGVGCRAQVLRLADAIGSLLGFVRNLPDGCVEIRVKGPGYRVEDFVTRLGRDLPSPIFVSRANVRECAADDVPSTGFAIQRDATN